MYSLNDEQNETKKKREETKIDKKKFLVESVVDDFVEVLMGPFPACI